MANDEVRAIPARILALARCAHEGDREKLRYKVDRVVFDDGKAWATDGRVLAVVDTDDGNPADNVVRRDTLPDMAELVARIESEEPKERIVFQPQHLLRLADALREAGDVGYEVLGCIVDFYGPTKPMRVTFTGRDDLRGYLMPVESDPVTEWYEARDADDGHKEPGGAE